MRHVVFRKEIERERHQNIVQTISSTPPVSLCTFYLLLSFENSSVTYMSDIGLAFPDTFSHFTI